MSTTPPLFGGNSEEQYRAQLEYLDGLVLLDAVTALEQLELFYNKVRGKYIDLEGQALCLMASALFFQSRYDESLPFYEATLSFAEQYGLELLRARVLNGLGNVYSLKGDNAQSMEYFYESARIARVNDDVAGWQRAMNNIALMYCLFGDYHESLQIHGDLAESANKAGLIALESGAKANILMARAELGDYKQAVALAEKYFIDERFAEFYQHHVVVLVYQAISLFNLSRYKESEEVNEKAIALAIEVSDSDYTSQAMLNRGRLEHKRGDLNLARETLEEALDLAERHGISRNQGKLHEALANVFEDDDMYKEASFHLRSYYGIEKRLRAENMEHRVKLMKMQDRVDQLREEVKQAKHDATHDHLTGLANRAHFREATEQYMRLHPESLVGFIFVDLDNFKRINDNYGHHVGDDLLIQMSQRLRHHAPPYALVSRRSGDEFTILLKHFSDSQEITQCAEGLLHILSLPFLLTIDPLATPSPIKKDFTITVSMGVAVGPLDGHDFQTLEKHADLAMFQVKHSGKNDVHLFESEDLKNELQNNLEKDLQEDLTDGLQNKKDNHAERG